MTVSRPYNTPKRGYDTCDACLENVKQDTLNGIGAVQLCEVCWNEVMLSGMKEAFGIVTTCALRPFAKNDIDYRAGQEQARDYIKRAILETVDKKEKWVAKKRMEVLNA